MTTLGERLERLGRSPEPDAVYQQFTEWVAESGISLYPHQDEAIVILSGAHTIVSTPTGSGKSLIAIAAHFASLAQRGRSYYTAPIKALVSEKFFALCDTFGADLVGMVTGDASINPDAPIVCCTAEIVANIALREGRDADIDQVVMDEFHFIADPDRGWAWQIGLTELPQAQLVIMSATLGDTTDLEVKLTERTGRPVAHVSDAVRPVPLVYSWSAEFVPDTVHDLLLARQAPLYIVHPSQGAAVERAQALMSTPLLGAEGRQAIKDAVGGFRFRPGFGRTLAKLVSAGIGVHHAGMLPRYRRLVETLAQQGVLPVICGTDTLGVGINVPIRTVLFTQLGKFDGRRQRLLRAREFHQIAGRAGRAGFDTVGYVVCQAPDYVIENEKALAKVGDDPKRRRGVARKKPPEGFVNYAEATFERLQAAAPEPLHARLRITHATILHLLQRDEDTASALAGIVERALDDARVRRALLRQALAIGRSLLRAGVVTRLANPTPGGRRYALGPGLQDDFALNQPLSAFAVAAIDLLDPGSPTYALDVVSVIEATLENPYPVLSAQQFRARGEAVAEMKADGIEYEERKELLEDVSWPAPLADLLEHALDVYTRSHPWVADEQLTPKSVVREMSERALTFGEYVAFHKVQRSEGLLLRYLSDAYRALRQTVTESARTEEFADVVEWLGEIVRMTDSSLLDEWEALTDPSRADDHFVEAPVRPLTGNPRAFRTLVRNAMFRRVQLIADDDVAELERLELADPAATLTGDDWDDAIGRYYDEHDEVLLDADARGPAFLRIEEHGRRWHVRQIISDPAGNHDWQIEAEVDLDASDDAEALVLHVLSFDRVDG